MRFTRVAVALPLLVVIGLVAWLYASNHPQQVRAAMETLRIWPTTTPTPTPRPTATPTPIPRPTARPSPTATLIPASREPGLPPPGTSGTGSMLQRPSVPRAHVEWYDPTTGIDLTVARVSTSRAGTGEAGQRMQYLHLTGEEQYFGNDTFVSTPWHFALRDAHGNMILPDAPTTHWSIETLRKRTRNPGTVNFRIPQGEATYTVLWYGDNFPAQVSRVTVHSHRSPDLMQTHTP